MSLFVLVHPMRFNRSCLATIFFLAAELVGHSVLLAHAWVAKDSPAGSNEDVRPCVLEVQQSQTWQARQIFQPARQAMELMACRVYTVIYSMRTDVRSCSIRRPSPARLQVVAQDQHVGSHLFAGCALLGQLVLGIVWAGLMVSTIAVPAPLFTPGLHSPVPRRRLQWRISCRQPILHDLRLQTLCAAGARQADIMFAALPACAACRSCWHTPRTWRTPPSWSYLAAWASCRLLRCARSWARPRWVSIWAMRSQVREWEGCASLQRQECCCLQDKLRNDVYRCRARSDQPHLCVQSSTRNSAGALASCGRRCGTGSMCEACMSA